MFSLPYLACNFFPTHNFRPGVCKVSRVKSLVGVANEPMLAQLVRIFRRPGGGLALEPGFQPAAVESFFEATSGAGGPPFTMLLPPPNVTGKLHIGHALTVAIQDAVARYHRMCGRRVSWIPGTDHAGIGTQSLVERKLKRERGLTRHHLTREAFLKELTQFKAHHSGAIFNQLARLGASVDWGRQFFTLDAAHSQAVTNAFVHLHRQNLIYRDARIVNWCPTLETAISDIEVEFETHETPAFVTVPGWAQLEVGVVYHIAYPVEGGEIVVATTRPETVLGDVALAVHPLDGRYRHLIGTHAHHPLIPGCRLPIICDAELVDPHHGTGVVKVTPAHDAADFACSQRNGLSEPISFFDTRGHIVASPRWPALAGLHRFAARSRVLEALEASGRFRGKFPAPGPTRVARCSRSGDIIEPWLRPQWFIRMAGMARRTLGCAESGALTFFPREMGREFKRWLGGIQDWCVSRQLVWGHRIPAYYARCEPGPGSGLGSTWYAQVHGQWFVADSERAALAEIRRQLEPGPEELMDTFLTRVKLTQDEDVLDTWFSSALLPLSVAGWRGPGSPLLGYPSQLLETGGDLLFFWVARMAMLCTHLHGLPFERVLLHPVIRDRFGRKMSKSLGNVIDPTHVIDGVSLEQLQAPLAAGLLPPAEASRCHQALANDFPEGIPACGVDALRFSLIDHLRDHQINLNLESVVAARHFVNKLWNAVRFYLQRRGQSHPNTSLAGSSTGVGRPRSLPDRYLLSKAAGCIQECHAAMAAHELHRVTEAIRKLTVNTVCDAWIEFSRPALSSPGGAESVAYLGWVLDVILRLAHPIMPFVTETLWHHLHFPHPPGARALMVAAYPTESTFAGLKSPDAEASFQRLESILRGARSLRQTNGIHPKVPLDFQLILLEPHTGPTTQPSPWLDPQGPVHTYRAELMRQSNMASLDVKWAQSAPTSGLLLTLETSDRHPVILLATPTVHGTDPTALDATLKRLTAKLLKLQRKREALLQTTHDPNYAARVPTQVQARNSDQLVEMDAELGSLRANLDRLAQLGR
ncbi:hypothetical protein L0F63_002754 [Massospora cicadina]|nr:hypothetical protein L0F63_002754 [Massospora cicadina]